MTALDISIVTFNAENTLPSLFASLCDQDCELSTINLLLHDNGSSDSTPALIEKFVQEHGKRFADITVSSSDNIGFGRAHNLATKNGKAPYLFILNPDTELPPTTLTAIIKELEQSDDNIAAWELRQCPYEHPKLYHPTTLETPWCSAAALIVRRDAFEQIGGFDDNIFLYGEDVDLSFRLREAGYTLRYLPQISITHTTYSTPQELKPAQFLGSMRANLMLRTRYGSWRDIGRGALRQCAMLLPSRQHVHGQRKSILKTFYLWATQFQHWRSGSTRSLAIPFRGWDYAPIRIGAFHATPPLEQAPLISVLIRTMGRKALLKDALTSLQHQTYTNFDVVIIEDGPDTLSDWLKDYDDLTIHYTALGKNKGRCHAGNAAMEHAKGDYFIFLDEDDMFYADHLEQLIAAALNEGSRIAYSYAFELPSAYHNDTIVEEGEPLSRFADPAFNFTKLLAGNYIPINTVLFHRSLYEECGGFDPNIDYNEDWNLWVRFALVCRPFTLVPKTTAIYRVPMDNQKEGGRHTTMVEHQARVRNMQAELTTTMTIEEILALTAQNPIEVEGLETALVRRFPRFQGCIHLLARTSRAIRGL